MLRVDLLIEEAREQTENVEYTSETGLQDSTFLRAMNDAQDKVMSLIHQAEPDLFEVDEEIDSVANQEAYSLPVDLYAGTMLTMVEYSATGSSDNYYVLDKGVRRERRNASGDPDSYFRQGSQILLQPRPQGAGGKIRVTYIRTIPKLDKRRGTVTAVTLDNTAQTISVLQIDPTVLTPDDVAFMNKVESICVVDRNGIIKMKGIGITSVNATTGDITIEPGFEFDLGETIAVGDYVVGGKFATTHSELPDTAERYLLQFAKWRAQKQDSSGDSVESNTELDGMAADIVATYRQPDKDVNEVPILDTQFLDC